MEGATPHVLLSNFNSYFELLIAFAFAYGGLSGFKNYFNKVSFRDYNLNYEKQLSNTLKALENVSGSKLQDLFNTKIKSLKDESGKIAAIERIAMGFYDGTFFQPMFFLVGLIYIFFLIIGGFQVNIGEQTLYVFVLLVSTASLVYFIFIFFKLRYHATRILTLENKWWLRSYSVLGLFFLVCMLSIVGASIISFILNELLNKLTSEICFKDQFCQCTTMILLETFGVLAALSLSFFPYTMYYYRDKFFLKHLEREYNNRKAEAEKELAELSELVEAVQDYQVIKTA